MKNKKFYIWSSDIGDIENWEREDNETGEMRQCNENDYEYVYELNSEYLDDERLNFKYHEKHNWLNRIIAIANIGTWNGRRIGYKVYSKIEDIFYSKCDDAEWYVENEELKVGMYHHDGSNYLVYRELKDNDLEDEICEFIYKSENYNNDYEELLEKLNKYTNKLGDWVAGIYGWEKSSEITKEAA